ncbi:MAG TPA: hypothetical protein VF648_00630 [Pyrinomonadaceae bacterium]|jgi:hypothetical protein
MDQQTQYFDLSDILAALHRNILDACGDFEGALSVLSFMAGEGKYKYEFFHRGQEIFKPEILRQHPELGEINAEGVNSENYQTWINQQKDIFGETLPLVSLNEDENADDFPEFIE